eukprot:TRINITY_DN3213_c0_g1_i2.p4 TRINITY_DN3213_c0_g1~~TRINITY_DN3213_c0_g1_i2.p4  ORF type:complete len:92 (-),score=14.43 TRINITY_DN3213_c0_g1_i2:1418-1693(-)
MLKINVSYVIELQTLHNGKCVMHQSNFDDLNLNMNIPRYTRENLTNPVRLQKYIPNNYGAKKRKQDQWKKDGKQFVRSCISPPSMDGGDIQ